MPHHKEDYVQVFRLVSYLGPRSRVEETIKNSLHGTKELGKGLEITAVTLGDFPTLLKKQEDSIDAPTQDATRRDSPLDF